MLLLVHSPGTEDLVLYGYAHIATEFLCYRALTSFSLNIFPYSLLSSCTCCSAISSACRSEVTWSDWTGVTWSLGSCKSDWSTGVTWPSATPTAPSVALSVASANGGLGNCYTYSVQAQRDHVKESKIREEYAKSCTHFKGRKYGLCDVWMSGRHMFDMKKSVDGLLNCLVVWYQSWA